VWPSSSRGQMTRTSHSAQPPLVPGSAGVVVGEQLCRLILRWLGRWGSRPGAAAGGLAVAAHQELEGAPDFQERADSGTSEGASRPHTATLLLELVFDYSSNLLAPGSFSVSFHRP
jgi:hypothetical protein